MGVTWESIRGQDAAVSLLARAAVSGRVAPAYLFCGPPGVGRLTTALAFAAALECREREGGACGACAACREVAHGTHPDVRLWRKEEGKKIFPIGLVREIIASLGLRSYHGRYKVAIVDEADTMNQEAANAFLLTLEEPPPGTAIILVASNPQLLPQTIASRCQRVDFRPLSGDLVVELLVAGGADAREAHVAALMAEGSLAAARDHLGEDWRRRWEGAASLAAAALAGDPAALFHPLVAAAAAREEADKLLQVLESIFRLALRRRLDIPADLGDAEGMVAGLGDALDLLGFSVALERIRQAQGLIRGNVNSRLVMEGLIAELPLAVRARGEETAANTRKSE